MKKNYVLKLHLEPFQKKWVIIVDTAHIDFYFFPIYSNNGNIFILIIV